MEISDGRMLPRTMPADYIEKVYAGWLGKVIGVRHGANIENWTADRIEKAFGEVNGYLFDFTHFAADDDTNGPLFFLRALEDYTHTRDITAKEMGLTWLNYTADGHGFFWWGGYGVSTEDTAYQNLKSGIEAPTSGSIEQNGKTVAEQIGGQIFSDAWGLIAPGQPNLAAEYAEKMASVSHDGNGKYGGMFIAACIAEAFVEQDVNKIIDAGLAVIPEDSNYARVVKAIRAFHKQHPESWRACLQYIHSDYGYDRYEGVCHIIPNTAVIILALLYGEGDYSKTINICNMCGWDTDCNVGNVGTIIGVKNGLAGIDTSWREPINDFLCCSSVIGSLNILDLPKCASYIARLGYKVMGETPPENWETLLSDSNMLHFEYPGSTHAFKVESDCAASTGFIENTTADAATGSRSLKVVFDQVNGGFGYRAGVKTYYRPSDFDDSRYDPSFSPILYPGQTIETVVKVSSAGMNHVAARLYIKDGHTGQFMYGEKTELAADQWTSLSYAIPYLENVCIEEAGIEWIPLDESGFISWPSMVTLIDHMVFTGEPSYGIDFAKERIEKWSLFHEEVSQMTHLRGIWTLEDGALAGSYHANASAEAYTGHIDWEDYTFECILEPQKGNSHNINFRVQGGVRSYAVGFKDGELVLYKNNNGYQVLTAEPFDWTHHQPYRLSVSAKGNAFDISVDGQHIMSYQDDDKPYMHGQIGFSNFSGSRTHYKQFWINPIDHK
ncbi:ADP-ribosylglycohydrolase family protein [Lentibacillus saliphilus]|uniref:ADP-ribosylglycohydrolase family protein n=1 Tax=Lentibacillus saliphilus TaxID=2737028 RepID=UPI001FE7CD81|nr:ADP-ribosylglycohydrolase family protein [Lentibacillus saliphilus]